MTVRFTGSVVPGHGRGKSLTFPTMNLKVMGLSVEPGVYAVKADILGEWHQAVMHAGARPTFNEEDPSIEIHFINFKGEVQPDQVHVEVLGRLRAIQRFDSSEALKKQIEQDIIDANVNYFQTEK